MANLFNNDIGLNYKGLINIGSTINQNISGSLQYLTDGDGNNLPLQINTTGLVLGNASAAVYINLNDSGINFFDAIETRYRNVAGTNIAMNVFGNSGRVAIGGLATNYTPTASLQVRGDGTNPIFRAENQAGSSMLVLTNAGALTVDGGIVSTTGSISGAYGAFTIGFTNPRTVFNFPGSSSYGGLHFLHSGSIIRTSGLSETLYSTATLANTAGSASYRHASLNYTINNTGAQTGNTTGIFLNATETNLNGMTHNLIDLQVGGVSRMTLNSNGNFTVGASTANNITYDNTGFRYVNAGVFKFFVSTAGRLLGYEEFRNAGNVFLGSIVVAPTARLHVRGDGTNPIARFENSAGVEFFSVSNTGVVNFATTGGSILLTPGSSPVLTLSTFFASAGGLQIQMNTSALSGAGTISKFVFTQAYALTGASATNVNELVINPSFTANANPGVFNGINLAPTINQTGGANGITRGVYVAPTLTSAADFRALDVLTGSTSGHKLIRLANAAGSKVFEVNAAQEIGLFGVTPIAQPTTGIAGATVTAGGGAAILEDDLFAGYTVAQIAQALVNLGILKP
jgi:hypothetical protein